MMLSCFKSVGMGHRLPAPWRGFSNSKGVQLSGGAGGTPLQVQHTRRVA